MEEDGFEQFGLLKLIKSSKAESGWMGVRPGPKNKDGDFKWQAFFTHNGTKQSVDGLYVQARDAAIQLAVKKQEIKLFGDGDSKDFEDAAALTQPSKKLSKKPRAPRGMPAHMPCLLSLQPERLWHDLSAGSKLKLTVGNCSPLSMSTARLAQAADANLVTVASPLVSVVPLNLPFAWATPMSVTSAQPLGCLAVQQHTADVVARSRMRPRLGLSGESGRATHDIRICGDNRWG